MWWLVFRCLQLYVCTSWSVFLPERCLWSLGQLLFYGLSVLNVQNMYWIEDKDRGRLSHWNLNPGSAIAGAREEGHSLNAYIEGRSHRACGVSLCLWPGSDKGLSSRGGGERAALETACMQSKTKKQSGKACGLSRTWEETWVWAALLLVAANQADTV